MWQGSRCGFNLYSLSIGRFTKRSCAPTTHTNYPNTTHALLVQSGQTGFLLRALTGKKSHQVVLMCCHPLRPAAGISESHWTISPSQWRICEQTSLEGKWFTAAAQGRQNRKTVNIPLAGWGSFNDAITASARHCNPALTGKSNVHQINRGSGIEGSISLCWAQVYCM